MQFNGAVHYSSHKRLEISSISSTESNLNIGIGKTWTVIDRLATIWKSDLSNKMGILPRCSHVSTTVWLHHLDFNEMIGEKVRWKLYKDVAYIF